MKLFRFGAPGAERPGVLLPDGARVDASGFGSDWAEAFFAQGGDGMAKLARWVAAEAGKAPRVPAGARLGVGRRAPVEDRVHRPQLPRPRARERRGAAGRADRVPEGVERAGRARGRSAPARGRREDRLGGRAGPGDRARAKNIPLEDAMAHVAGFVLHNDYSERGFQLERHGQWTKGKSADGFAPVGPFLSTPDELPGFASVRLWLKVNGEIKQDGNTADMIFDVPTLVSYVSRFMTLLPGDVISTGTPAGVGLGHKPPLYLRAGDVVEYGIDGLGQARQRILAAE